MKQEKACRLKTVGFNAQEIEGFAELHQSEIQNGFLTSLGQEALRLLYSEIAENHNCIVVAGFQDGEAKPVGFIVGTVDCAALYRDFLKRNGLSALRVFLPRLLSWTRLRKAFETLLYPTKQCNPVLPGAEILNFAVRPAYRGTGLAQTLFLELMHRFAMMGVGQVKIVAGEGQRRAHKFYEKMGAKQVGWTSVHKGQNDLVFVVENKVSYQSMLIIHKPGMVKRVFDLFFSLLGLTVLLPFILLVAIWIRLTSRGPAFYRGVRVGRGGKRFRLLKFRTMVADAEQLGGPSTPDDDPRITKVGRILRRYKLDELPQLFNVLKGEMSLVGPRPEVPLEVDLYTPQERELLSVTPGITDWASIRFRNEGEILRGSPDPHLTYRETIRPEKIRLGLEYTKHHSFWVDLRIILTTLWAIAGGKPEVLGEMPGTPSVNLGPPERPDAVLGPPGIGSIE
jgi:lipopolysaccharide/colanic/teichoic acid biosynthesis glycosyltransferase/ribosomal protein S18 acetylase RimI-like enzyme